MDHTFSVYGFKDKGSVIAQYYIIIHLGAAVDVARVQSAAQKTISGGYIKHHYVDTSYILRLEGEWVSRIIHSKGGDYMVA